MDIDIEGGWNSLWYNVATTLPKILVFLLILLVGWLIAKGLSALTDKILERVGFDRVVERSGLRGALSRSRVDASDLVAMVVYWAIILITLTMAFAVFGPNPISDLLEGVVAWLPQLLVAIVIVIVATALASGLRTILEAALGHLSFGRWIAQAAWLFVVGLGVIAALNQVGIAVTVTVPVLIAVLATIGGILVVGVGGGLIRPMQDRWERWLRNAEGEVSAPTGSSGVRPGRVTPVAPVAPVTPVREDPDAPVYHQDVP